MLLAIPEPAHYYCESDEEHFFELVGLMTRYQLDISCLRQLCEAQIDPWFKEPKSCWYTTVFG